MITMNAVFNLFKTGGDFDNLVSTFELSLLAYSSRVKLTKHYVTLNEARATNLNVDRRILKSLPFLKKDYIWKKDV